LLRGVFYLHIPHHFKGKFVLLFKFSGNIDSGAVGDFSAKRQSVGETNGEGDISSKKLPEASVFEKSTGLTSSPF
jgi:hypothetical protein